MIQRFNRHRQSDYYNIFQLGVIFLTEEALEILEFFNAFDRELGEFNYRRIFWIGMLSIILTLISTLVSTTCMTYLIHNMG